jgi:hypothetical protein
MRTLRGSNAKAVIAALNPIIRGWTAYHRGMVSRRPSNRSGTTRGGSPTSGHGTRTRTSQPAGGSAGTTASSARPGTTSGSSATGKPAPTCSGTPGRASGGTSRSRDGHPPMTRTWPDTGKTGGARTAPHSTRAPSPCSPGRRTGARTAGTRSSTPAARPPPPRTGKTGGSASPARTCPAQPSRAEPPPRRRATEPSSP